MKTHWIAPEDRQRPPLPLSIWDETLVSLHSGKTWFFDRSLDPDQVVAGLEGALRTLPCLAGRLRSVGPGRHEVHYDVGRGARIDLVDVKRRMPTWAEPGLARRSVKGLMPASFLRPVDRDVPLLWAKVTRFADGRSALGVVYSHALLDGGGSALLAKAWAAACDGRPMPEATDPRAELGALADIAEEGESGFFDPVEGWPLLKKQLSLGVGALRSKTSLVGFEGDALEAAAEGVRSRTGEFASPKDALTAAIGVAALSGAPTRVTAVVDLRRKFRKRFPDGYVGNLCIAPTRDLGEAPSFDEYALAVRGCIEDATATRFGADVKSRLGHDPAKTWPRAMDACLERGLMQDSWANPANYEVDFGAGTAQWLDLPDAFLPGLTLLMPDPAKRGRTYAMVGLDRERHRRLEGALGEGTPLERGARLLKRFAS